MMFATTEMTTTEDVVALKRALEVVLSKPGRAKKRKRSKKSVKESLGT